MKKEYYLRIVVNGLIQMIRIKKKDVEKYKKYKKATSDKNPCGQSECKAYCDSNYKCILYFNNCSHVGDFKVVEVRTFYACDTAIDSELGETDVLFFKTKKDLIEGEGCIKECGYSKLQVVREL
jgi:hypothetical protein